MNVWSNIVCSESDPEILAINAFEKKLGPLPNNAKTIRELITRFEGCHFKYERHLKLITSSIDNLSPRVKPSGIGQYHCHNGYDASKNDATGRSFLGLQYLDALKRWLGNAQNRATKSASVEALTMQVHKWLGEKNQDKQRLVKLLVARLTWDWKSCEALQEGGVLKDMELQAIRMDICHHNFPKNIHLVLDAIGRQKPVSEDKFEGCGTYNDSINAFLKREFFELNDWLKASQRSKTSQPTPLIRVWLNASLAKTIKETIGCSEPVALLKD